MAFTLHYKLRDVEGATFDTKRICCKESYFAYACAFPSYFAKLFKHSIAPLPEEMEYLNKYEVTANAARLIRGRKQRLEIAPPETTVITVTTLEEPERRVVNGHALVNLGADLIVALHNDEVPVNYREFKKTHRPHLSTFPKLDGSCKFAANQRGHNVP